MALLNYSNTYREVLNEFNTENNINITDPSQLSAKAKGYIKLFFTGDGNIITHGVNYLPLFTQSYTGKGLVPVNVSELEKDKDFLRGDGSWNKITTADLPIYQTGKEYDTTSILNSFQVQQLVNSSFTANDAMRFKGVISSQSEIISPWEPGDTYRVAREDTYYHKFCEVGDLIICITKGDSSDNAASSHWAVVQGNINGTKDIILNGTTLPVFLNTNIKGDISIFGPTAGGKTGDILIGKGYNNAPVWADPSDLTVGTATKVSKSLTVGAGLSMGKANDVYNGSADKIINLIKATTESLGGIKIDGETNPTLSIKEDGTIYISQQNIYNALGYIPANPDNIVDRDILVGGESIGSSALNFLPTGDIYVKVDNNTVDGSYDIGFGLSWYNISANNGQGGYETA